MAARRRGRRNRNQRRSRKPQHHQLARGRGFWGDEDKLPPFEPNVRITDDPAALVRSLGTPTLPGHEKWAEPYFAHTYNRAVTMAGALAAAGGLIEPEELVEELGE